MVLKLVQTGLRGITLTLMLTALIYNSETKDLTSLPHFLMSGVYGSFVIVCVGLLIETALNQSSDIQVISSLLVIGITLNIICCILAFSEFSKSPDKGESSTNVLIHLGFISMLGATVFAADLVFSCFYTDTRS